jgi:hypothetical protein
VRHEDPRARTAAEWSRPGRDPYSESLAWNPKGQQTFSQGA